MTAPIDYSAVLTDLRARRAQLDAAISVIETLLGGVSSGDESSAQPGSSIASLLAPTAVPPSPASSHATSAEVRNDMYFKLSTAGAVRKFLTINKRPASPRVIAQALQDGGQIHAVNEKVAYTNVYSVLKRLKDKDFVQTRTRDWGLAEWYTNKPKGDAD